MYSNIVVLQKKHVSFAYVSGYLVPSCLGRLRRCNLDRISISLKVEFWDVKACLTSNSLSIFLFLVYMWRIGVSASCSAFLLPCHLSLMDPHTGVISLNKQYFYELLGSWLLSFLGCHAHQCYTQDSGKMLRHPMC